MWQVTIPHSIHFDDGLELKAPSRVNISTSARSGLPEFRNLRSTLLVSGFPLPLPETASIEHQGLVVPLGDKMTARGPQPLQRPPP